MDAVEIVKHDNDQGRRRTPIEDLDPANFPSQKRNDFVKAADDRQIEHDVNDRADPGIHGGGAATHLRRDDLQLQSFKRRSKGTDEPRDTHEP